MIKCMQCGNENLDVANYCDACGAALPARAEAHRQERPGAAGDALSARERRPTRGVVRSLVTGIEYSLEPGKEYMIGRGDPAKGLRPEICLDEPAALQQGTSRLHAKILYQAGDFYIVDLSSTNATYLNGAKLTPQQAYSLRSGDTVELGRYKLSFAWV
ncbi:MAG: FHA domain-containing protein [Actinobacteria bacterium]|nr:FHA domain-containing protein [Actinomycetota bacterium]